MYSFFIENILGHIPVWVWAFFIGIGGVVNVLLFMPSTVTSIISHVPAIKNYLVYAKAIAIAFLVISLIMFGADGAVQVYKQQTLANVAANKGVIDVATQASAGVNEKIDATLAGKDAVVAERVRYITTIIHDSATTINTDCKLVDDAAWQAYNNAVNNTTGATAK